MNIFTSHPTNKGPTPEGENPMNAPPKTYLRFVAPAGACVIVNAVHTAPHQGMEITSTNPIYMFARDDDPMRWAKNIFCESTHHTELHLWEVIPEGRVQEGWDDMFSVEHTVYPEFVCYGLTYIHHIATAHRTMSKEELSCLFAHYYNEALVAGFDEIEAWTYAFLTHLEADFVRIDYHDPE